MSKWRIKRSGKRPGKTPGVILTVLGLTGAGEALASASRAAGYPTWEYAVLAVVIVAAVVAVTTCCRRMVSPYRP